MCHHVQHVYHGFLIHYKYVRDFQQCVIKSILMSISTFRIFLLEVFISGTSTYILYQYIFFRLLNIYIYINSFIIPKTSYNSYDFYSGWLLSQNLGILNIQMEKRGIYGRKSANVRFPCTCL